ncbi:MAG: chromosome segregation protein SMC, partial [Clostridia bacterium]|nr:chromosome segregation protein SMC [Clostridia bacterium]
IVGPNGSGKSNIADAMRWVLGEVSSKSLRGSKMEDVIFGGADSRRPMGYAEVSVTFDNTSDFCKLDCPYDTVTVTRRYFRAGESEYLINRKAVRLKDIYELFLNTGIGRDGYSIIGQGRIAEMISRKSEERRSVFEDASGIALFRVRKNDAQRRLDAVETNMVRIRDVFAEVEAQVGPLEKEAAKAKKGIVLLEARKKADVRLWLYDTDRLTAGIREAETERSHADFDLGQAKDALQSLEVQNERLTEMDQESRRASGELNAEINRLSGELHTLDSEYRVRESHIGHASDLIASTGENKRILSENLASHTAEAEAHSSRRAALLEKLAGQEREYAGGEAEQTRLRTSIGDLDALIIETGETLRAKEQEAVDIRVRLSVLENARNSGSDRNTDLLSDMESYESTARTLGAEVARREKTVQGYRDSLAENEAALKDMNVRLADMNGKYGQEYEALGSRKLHRDSIRQRISTYKAMEEHYDGYAASVKFVMNQYAAGRITSFGNEPCGTIWGPLSQVISVDKPYVTAVECALGANLQHIVVQDEATAKAAMYALKANNAGRATFFPLTSMRPQTVTPDMTQAAGFPGYVAVADTLVSCDDRFRNVVSSLLGRTLVFDTIDHATDMAKALRYRVRVVTLDGQQINVGGSFTGGSLAQKNGALSRAAEIRSLSTDLEACEKAVRDTEEALAKARDSIREAQDERDGLQDKHDLLKVLMDNENAQLDKAKAARDANGTLLERMKADCEQILRQSEQYETDMAALKAEETALGQTIEAIRELRESKVGEKADAEEALETLTNAQTARLIAVSETRKDAETEGTFADSFAAQAEKDRADIVAADEKIAGLKADIERYRGEQTENRAAYADGEARLAALVSDKDRADENSADYERKLADLRSRINAKYEEKENLFKVFTTADAKLTALLAEKAKLDSRLMEDYEMTRTEAVTLAAAMGWEPVTEENRREVTAEQTECRNKLRALGHFDPDAVEKYTEVRERYDSMSAQIEDLEKSRTELTGIISKLESQMKTSFTEAFNAINDNFRQTFSELFGGGSAEVSLTDPDNVLESGIEIKAAPPGKIIKNLMQLSGGEQAFVGVALFFAILKVNPTPFCILDEVEAALDEVNVERLAQYVRRYSDGTQFIMITHRRGTMAAADRLYGVTMPERGISKVLTLDVADIAKNKENNWNGLFS